MPAYNAAPYIREAIDSILSQSYEDFELLIADDASTDETKSIIDSYSDRRIRKFHNTRNLKKPLTVQKLFEHSDGDLITMHDADDVSLPTRFEKVVEVFTSNAEVFMCGHIIERISENGKRLGLFRNKTSDYDEIKLLMKMDNTDGDPSLFVRRVVIADLGEIFRPYFKNNMDYDFALRVLEKYKSTNVLEVLSYYRNVPNSISKGTPTYHKLITQGITQFLAKQRSERGYDSLQEGDMEIIQRVENELSQPYLKDRTLHLRKMASFFMYCKMNNEAIKFMFMAVMKEPQKIENWKTLQYCIRKTIIGI